MFHDRHDAGRRLAWELGRYKDRRDALVLGVPRGGAPVAAAAARELGLPLDVALVQGIGHPDDPRVSVGALALTGVALDPEAGAGLPPDYVAAVAERILARLRARYWSYRRALKPLSPKGRIAILIDDESTSGRSLALAASRLRLEGASRIVAAVPVATREAARRLRDASDELVCLREVARAAEIEGCYAEFPRVGEDEALEEMTRAPAGARD